MCFSLVFVLTRLWDILHCKCWNTCLHSYTTITDQNTYFNNLNAVQLLTDKCKCILKIIKITNQAFCTDIFSGQRESSKSNKTFYFIINFRVSPLPKRSCFILTIYTWLDIYWHIVYVVWYIVLCCSILHWLCDESEEHYMTIVFRTIANYPLLYLLNLLGCDHISAYTAWPRKQK